MKSRRNKVKKNVCVCVCVAHVYQPCKLQPGSELSSKNKSALSGCSCQVENSHHWPARLQSQDKDKRQEGWEERAGSSPGFWSSLICAYSYFRKRQKEAHDSEEIKENKPVFCPATPRDFNHGLSRGHENTRGSWVSP